MKRLAFVLLLLPLPAPAEMEPLDDGTMAGVDGADGITLDIYWRLDADAAGNRTGNNSLPVRLAGQSAWLIFHNNSGAMRVEDLRFDIEDTPAALGPVTPALKVTPAGPWTFDNWRIDEVSIGSSAASAPGENGKIAHFETDATWRFGSNTAAWFFQYEP